MKKKTEIKNAAIILLLSVIVYAITSTLVGLWPGDEVLIKYVGWFAIAMMIGGAAFRAICILEIKKGLLYVDAHGLTYRFPPLSSWLMYTACLLTMVLIVGSFRDYYPFFQEWIIDNLPFDGGVIFGWPSLVSGTLLAFLTVGGWLNRDEALTSQRYAPQYEKVLRYDGQSYEKVT